MGDSLLARASSACKSCPNAQEGCTPCMCASSKPCSTLSDTLMASGLDTYHTPSNSTCQLPTACAFHNFIRAPAHRRCGNVWKCIVGCDRREERCPRIRTKRKHVGAHRAVADAGSTQAFQDIDADGKRPAMRLSPPGADSPRQTYPGSAEGAHMEVLADKADSAHALAVLHTQRPTQSDTGVLYFAVRSSGRCSGHLQYILCGCSISAVCSCAVPLLMVSRPLPRVLLIHTGGTLGTTPDHALCIAS